MSHSTFHAICFLSRIEVLFFQFNEKLLNSLQQNGAIVLHDLDRYTLMAISLDIAISMTLSNYLANAFFKEPHFSINVFSSQTLKIANSIVRSMWKYHVGT